jgi:shikimate kinase
MSLKLEKTVFLIGFMGSGKSTVGKQLAQEFGVSFLDSDAEIEQNAGKTISEIFETEGEVSFRELEQEFILKTDFTVPKIVSCGGGLPCFNGLMNVLKEKGTVVFLNVEVKEIIRRLGAEKSKRPLISAVSDLEFEENVRERLQNRMEVYLFADRVVEIVTGMELDEVVSECLMKLSK